MIISGNNRGYDEDKVFNMKKTASAEEFINKHPQWRPLLEVLRSILGSTELEETIKWGVPVYTLDGKNVVGIAAFKKHAALWFHQGALLSDPAGKLVNAQEGKTQAQRQWRFLENAVPDEKLILSYVLEAIENQRAGKIIKPVGVKSLSVPHELESAFESDPDLKAAFKKLAPYKQREYAEHITSAKREDTRLRRLDKILPMIKGGKGLNDRYRC